MTPQARFGGSAAIGKRDPYPIPKGPVKKAPTLARTGGQVARGTLVGARIVKSEPLVAVAKRARSYDPEVSRQRRLGGAVAASSIAGSALVASGGSDIHRDSKRLSDLAAHGYHVGREPTRPPMRKRGPTGAFVEIPDEERKALQDSHDIAHARWARKKVASDTLGWVKGERRALVGARPAGKVGAGLGLLAVGAGLAHQSHRRWS